MGADEILELMKQYFVGKQPAEVLANFGDQMPRALLKESLDIVEFVMQIEGEVGREIDINELSDTLLNSTFRDLSVKISEALAESA